MANPLNLDDHFEECLDKAIDPTHVLVVWFLAASYLYYHHDVSILSDDLYDLIAHNIRSSEATRRGVKEHKHGQLIDDDALRAGSLYALPEEAYPERIKGAANALYNRLTRQSKAASVK